MQLKSEPKAVTLLEVEGARAPVSHSCSGDVNAEAYDVFPRKELPFRGRDETAPI